MPAELPTFYARDRAAWRRWLARKHERAQGVWLVRYKAKTGKPCVSYEDSVEEALCFGWIDGRMQRVDDEHHVQMFTRRRPKSTWAASNKRRVAALKKAGLMMPAGLAAIEEAKRNGSWTSLDAAEALEVPADLTAALRKKKSAAANFEAFSPSAKKAYLYWILSAKRPETRAARIADSVRYAAQNLKLDAGRDRDRSARKG